MTVSHTIYVDRAGVYPESRLVPGVNSSHTGARVSLGYDSGKIIFGWRLWVFSGSSIGYAGAAEENYDFGSGTSNLGQQTTHISAQSNGGWYRAGSFNVSGVFSLSSNDYVVIALDMDEQEGWIGAYKSSTLTWLAGDPAAGSSPTYTAANAAGFFTGNPVYAAANSDGSGTSWEFIGLESGMPWAIPAGFSAYDPGSSGGGGGGGGSGGSGLIDGIIGEPV